MLPKYPPLISPSVIPTPLVIDVDDDDGNAPTVVPTPPISENPLTLETEGGGAALEKTPNGEDENGDDDCDDNWSVFPSDEDAALMLPASMIPATAPSSVGAWERNVIALLPLLLWFHLGVPGTLWFPAAAAPPPPPAEFSCSLGLFLRIGVISCLERDVRQAEQHRLSRLCLCIASEQLAQKYFVWQSLQYRVAGRPQQLRQTSTFQYFWKYAMISARVLRRWKYLTILSIIMQKTTIMKLRMTEKTITDKMINSQLSKKARWRWGAPLPS